LNFGENGTNVFLWAPDSALASLVIIDGRTDILLFLAGSFSGTFFTIATVDATLCYFFTSSTASKGILSFYYYLIFSSLSRVALVDLGTIGSLTAGFSFISSKAGVGALCRKFCGLK
jgi:hypothetical protein